MCECGRAPKEYSKSARDGYRRLAGCRYCNDLDGKTAAERDVVNVLRSIGYASAQTVLFERNAQWRATYRHLRRMVKRGRIEQFRDVIDFDPTDQLQYRLAPIHSRGAR